MPALAQPTPNEVIATLSIGGVAGKFGRWDGQTLTDYVAGALVDPLEEEYDYAVEIIQDAGLDDQNLTATQYAAALKGLMNAIAYRLLDLDWNSAVQIPAEPDNALHRKHYQTQMAIHFKRAGYAWKGIGITSKYYQSATAGFPATGFVQNCPDSLNSYDNYPYNG